MPDGPIRLLFVINQFGQGGSERYLFELCSALDRRRFDLTVLTRTDVNREAFYYPRLERLGVPIARIRPHVPDLRRVMPSVGDSRAYRMVRHRLSSAAARWRIGTFLRSFDIVACIQIENYLELQHALSDRQAVVIHAMSNRFQYAYDPYDEFGPRQRYQFVTFDASQSEEMSRLERAEVFEWPLSMNFSAYPELSLPARNGEPHRIGIFTRLSREKPLKPLFESFKKLLIGVDATLHVYGGGDPAIFADVVSVLGIADRVTFEGHRESLIETARQDRLSLCWLMSVGTLLGYASIELAAAGMPMAFWNYGSWSTERIRRETGGAVHSFQSAAELAEFSQQALREPARLVDLGRTLRERMLARHDINKNISSLQDHYATLVLGQLPTHVSSRPM